MKLIKRVLIITAIIFSTVIIILGLVLYNRFNITPFDRARNLSGKIETIEVAYINWACDCPNWIETKYYKGKENYEAKEEDCIFIEPASAELIIPEKFNGFENNLKLTGQFYKDKAIAKYYEMKTPEKPEKTRVFRYTKFEIIKK